MRQAEADHLRFTIYDLRFTIYDLESSRACARILRSKCERDVMKAVIGRSYKGAGRRRQAGPAYVRGTTRTTAPMRAHAQRAVSAYGQRACAAPQGRTGRVVPVSQLSMYDCQIRARCAEMRSGGGRDVVKPCAEIVTKGRWRLTPPMYDFRCTMYDGGT